MEAEALKAMFDKIIALNILPAYMPNKHKDTEGNDTASTNHFRVSVTPLSPERQVVCSGKSSNRWVLQIVVAIQEGQGAIDSAEYIDSLRAGIKLNTTLTSGGYEFRSTDNGIVSAPIQSTNGWYLVPVQFTFETIA